MYRRAVAAGVYGGVLRTAVRALKYKGVSGVAAPLGRLAAAQIPATCPHALVVAVPPHSARTARRGLDHAALIAAYAADAAGVGVAKRGLVRVRATRQQYSLDPCERRTNVAGAFEAGRAIAGREVILVDDVHTTGATADECAAALLLGGALAVDVCTVARAVLPPPTDVLGEAAFGGPSTGL